MIAKDNSVANSNLHLNGEKEIRKFDIAVLCIRQNPLRPLKIMKNAVNYLHLKLAKLTSYCVAKN